MSTGVESATSAIREWQKPLIERLHQLKTSQRLPHALILEYPDQADATALARYAAKTLLCGEQNAPCGQCRECQLMDNQVHPDFSYVTLELNEKTKKNYQIIRVEQIRTLIHSLSLSQQNHRGKVAVIYPAEKMHVAAANSLLKTLEEPTEQTTLLLVSHRPGLIPVTIRSRCQLWRYNIPHREAQIEWLKKNAVNENLIAPCMELSGNRPEAALNLAQQGIPELFNAFKEQFGRLLNGTTSVVDCAGTLSSHQPGIARLLLAATLLEQIQKLRSERLTAHSKKVLIGLLNIHNSIHQQLATEENNLNLQLQLEDMLISVKQIIQSLQRRQSHGQSQSGNTFTEHQG